MRALLLTLLAAGCVSTESEAAPQADAVIEAALARAGDNRAQLEAALERVEESERPGMEFLIRYMPDGDLKSLDADFLVEHVRYAYKAWEVAPWKDAVPEEYFFNNVLPYASINERRDSWRKDFFERFSPLVAEAKTPSEATAILNQKVFPMVNVKYSTQRPKADQSPYESIDASIASCTGLSVLLIDACRAVGVPARFVGTPRWSDDSGNHSWIEIYDDGWHFTGAAEPTGDELNRAWFTGRAANAVAISEVYGIFAVSYKPTPQRFPMVWRPDADYVHAVNVTARYTGPGCELTEGYAWVRFKVTSAATGQRVPATVAVADSSDSVLFDLPAKDERFDANDHVTKPMKIGGSFRAHASYEGLSASAPFTVREGEQLISLTLEEGLTKEEAAAAEAELWDAHAARIRAERAAEMEARVLTHGEHKMPFWYTTYGDAPEGEKSFIISMHGGGGAPAAVNDQQYENQKGLYKPSEGVYLAPRAPTNTWNLWHQGHIDVLFDRLIENMIVFEGVDPDRVYLTGYSAGGDGVWRLAPRMADRWAASAMMAGHPGGVSMDNLRNSPFTVQMGGKDGAYNRNGEARKYKEVLAKLHEADPEGYDHWVEIYEDKGHWMDREDAAAIPWMLERTRDLRPKKVVWRVDGSAPHRSYWLSQEAPQGGSRVVVELVGQEIHVLECENTDRLTFRLDDSMIDLDEPIKIRRDSEYFYIGKVPRKRSVLEETLAERGDPKGMFSAEVTVDFRTDRIDALPPQSESR
ncbi:MAG: polyhydroxyalkanoate depolymerase [Planctomycetes bacterium]|nr:polyhydroxyalkanoate depolymerase [Planctomycetota bacterium]